MQLLPTLTYPDGTTVWLWQMDEDAPQLAALCHDWGIDIHDTTHLAAKRQREVLATRLLLHTAGINAPLTHDDNGAPRIAGSDLHVSISHTASMVCLAVNPQHPIGVDVERCDRQQVLRVRHKFLNASEQTFIPADDLFMHIIAWTAKEAIIKLSHHRDIDWTHDIRLHPFTVANSNPIEITATYHTTPCHLLSQICNNHIVTLAW